MPEQDNRPSTLHDLVRHLSDTLVNDEVMAPMEKIQWGHGTPPPPTAGTTPAPGVAPPPVATQLPTLPGTTPAPVAPAAAPATVKTDAPVDILAEFESMRGANGLILDKYATPLDAVKGVGHAVTMAKSALGQKDQLEKELNRLTEELKQKSLTPPVVSPTTVQSQTSIPGVPSRGPVEKAQAAYDAVLLEVVENGGALDMDAAQKLSAAQRELARLEAQYAAEESHLRRDANVQAENAKWNEVDAYMDERFPEAKNFADEISLFVQSDPLVATAVTAVANKGNEKGAAELAWKMFSLARGVAVTATQTSADQARETHLQAADQVRKEALAAARMDAGIMTTSASGGHEAPNAGPSQAEIDAAAVAMRAYGTQPGNAAAARWRELTIGKDLPDSIFGL